MVWIAAAGWVGYGVALAAVRVTLGRRWRGTRFVALDPRRLTAAEWVASVLAAVAGPAAVGGTVLAAVDGRSAPGPWVVAGAAGMAAGIGLMVWAQLEMGASWRIGVDHGDTTPLITTGPYRWVRNPIYTAMVMASAGAAAVTGSRLVAVGLVAAVLFAEWQVRVVEEAWLLGRHGDGYAQWAAGTGRFVPGIGARRPPGRAPLGLR
jgi:protein-S-isoprenylcysteine O-methyltransferase Ste14